MELILLRAFQKQVFFQCEFVTQAAKDTHKAVTSADVVGTFFALQNLLTAAANISKALWGPMNRPKIAAARRSLRESLGVDDDSPLRAVWMRNNFEHMDERLDEWWASSQRRHYCDMNIAARNSFSEWDAIDRFRLFDPNALQLEFWGESFDLQAVFVEVQRIRPKVFEEAFKLTDGDT